MPNAYIQMPGKPEVVSFASFILSEPHRHCVRPLRGSEKLPEASGEQLFSASEASRQTWLDDGGVDTHPCR